MKNNLSYKLFFLLLVAFSPALYAQTDTLLGESEVVIAASKWEQKLNEVPNKITKVSKRDILLNNPQTAADLLAQTGAVYVQKSQLGGGSPMIRGFATNRILLVIDGVRMNNAIYRSGNLQNIISLDALATETAEVVFGPGSIIYGSDAIGGVMDFHSLEARLSQSKKLKPTGSALVRYSTANQERTAHADVSLGGKKWAWMGSVTYSSFDDLVMGKNGGQSRYLRPQYVQRIGNRDSIFNNPNPRKQMFSGYNQWNVVQKLRFAPSEHIDLQYSFYYGGTGTAPRYDRLIEYRNGLLRFAQWDYGPMLWRMHSLRATFSKANALYDEARLVAGYQNYEESRIDRQRNNLNQRTQLEQVKVFTANADASKQLSKGTLYYGAELVTNEVGSMARSLNINTGIATEVATRYPNGSTWNSLGAYGSYHLTFKEQFTLTTGLRYNHATVNANFNSKFFPFPFTTANLSDGALTGSLGLVYRPAGGWKLSGNMSTGFRVPNIDDLGKLFESTPGNVTVPNPSLSSEYAWNFEVGISNYQPGKWNVELNAFHTLLDNAIVRRPFTFNGQDSILFDGVKSRVEALQNIGKATVYGLQALAELWATRQLSFYSMATYTTGKETDDENNEQVALRHAPPFFGTTGAKFRHKRISAEVFAQYNSQVSYNKLAPSERAKPTIYAQDLQGRPYSPAWTTLNARGSYQFSRLLLTLALENITNQRYRPYSNGIVAPGFNLVVGLRASL